MIIESKRIGRVEFEDNKIITFAEGILGFPTLTRFVLCNDPIDETMPFKWFVSIDNPELMFLVTDPGLFFKDYVFDLTEEERNSLQIESTDDVNVVSVVTVPTDPKQMTANLRGPLVINWRIMKGRQIVLQNTHYETKHLLFPSDVQTAATAAKEEKSTSDIVLPPDVVNQHPGELRAK